MKVNALHWGAASWLGCRMDTSILTHSTKGPSAGRVMGGNIKHFTCVFYKPELLHAWLRIHLRVHVACHSRVSDLDLLPQHALESCATVQGSSFEGTVSNDVVGNKARCRSSAG